MNIYEKLKKPFFALAPMEDVTDSAFRQVINELGRPELFFTEFTSVEGMFSPGQEEVETRLKYSDIEKPLIAQIWGKTPKMYYEGAKRISKMGFDGIDINMGCPVRKIVKQGACSALIKSPDLAKEIYLATKEGAGDIPVSIKTRIGFDKVVTEEWIGFLLELHPTLLTVHGRIASEMSKKPCDWNEIEKSVKLRNEISPETLLMGNGDVSSRKDGLERVKKYGVDGIMIGRAALNNPWVFSEDGTEKTKEQRIKALKLHLQKYRETWGEKRNFQIMKKFVKGYISGFPNSAGLRYTLMESSSLDQLIEKVEEISTA